MASEEDLITGLIVCWYATHRANGGAQDAIAEQLLKDVMIKGLFEVD